MRSIQWLLYLHQAMTTGHPNFNLTIEKNFVFFIIWFSPCLKSQFLLVSWSCLVTFSSKSTPFGQISVHPRVAPLLKWGIRMPLNRRRLYSCIVIGGGCCIDYLVDIGICTPWDVPTRMPSENILHRLKRGWDLSHGTHYMYPGIYPLFDELVPITASPPV